MSVLNIQIPDLTGNEKTFLRFKANATETLLQVQSNQGFTTNKYVIVGNPGTEQAEIRKISSITGEDEININALKYSHAQTDPITIIDYNQAKIYGSATENGTYTLIATVDLEVDIPDGLLYNDASSGSEFYKISYYNSTSAVETEQSGVIPAEGFDENTLYMMIEDVLDLCGDPQGTYITREQVRRKLNAHQDMWWFSPYTKRDTKVTREYSIIQDQDWIDLESDFDKFQNDYSVLYRFNPSGAVDEDYCLEIISVPQYNEEFGDHTNDSSDDLEACALFESGSTKRLKLGPVPATSRSNVISIDMHIRPAKMVNPEDKTICPHPRILTYGVAAEIVMNSDKTKADNYMAMQTRLQSGEPEHGRTKGGSSRIRFRADYGRNRYRRNARRRYRSEYDF